MLYGGERSFAQEGEDRILVKMFDAPDGIYRPARDGFYVDVGALDPMRFSNTHLFYRRGWRGVNIDATPGSMRLFNRYRPRDTNIETGIGLDSGTMPFYVFTEPALNSFDRELSESRHAVATEHKLEQYRIEKIVDVPVEPLSAVISRYLPDEDVPSFLSVDVEGVDLEVLQSNDWSAFRPTYVLAESLRTDIEETMRGPISVFMGSVGYHFIAKTANTAFYHRISAA